MPPMLPGTDPLGSLARAMAAAHSRAPHSNSMSRHCAGILNAMGSKLFRPICCWPQEPMSQCKLLIVIDQFEELLTQTDPLNAPSSLRRSNPALGGPVQVLATLRPEFLDPLRKDADLSKLALRIPRDSPAGMPTRCAR